MHSWLKKKKDANISGEFVDEVQTCFSNGNSGQQSCACVPVCDQIIRYGVPILSGTNSTQPMAKWGINVDRYGFGKGMEFWGSQRRVQFCN